MQSWLAIIHKIHPIQCPNGHDAYIWVDFTDIDYRCGSVIRDASKLVATATTATFQWIDCANNNIIPVIRRQRFVWAVAETFAFTIVIILVIIFLRPISQFIYFQF